MINLRILVNGRPRVVGTISTTEQARAVDDHLRENMPAWRGIARVAVAASVPGENVVHVMFGGAP